MCWVIADARTQPHETLLVRIPLELRPRHLTAVHRVGAIRQTQGAQAGPHAGQRHVLRHAHGAVHLHRLVGDLQRDARRHHLDLGDPGRRLARGGRVHHVGGLQAEQPRHLDLHAALGDDVVVGAELGQRLAERLAGQRAPAHQLQRPLGLADGAHAVVDAARPQSTLRHLEAAAATEDQVVIGHSHVLEADMHVAVRGVVAAVDVHGAHDLHAFGPGRHQDLGVALVLLGRVRVGADHDDVDPAARVAGARGEPLLAVQHPLLALGSGLHGDVGGIGGGDARLGHDVGRADLALQQRLQPLLLVRWGAVALQNLHVAGVGCGAVEGLRRQARPAHLLGEVRIFDGRQPVALVGGREPEVPQPPLARLGLQALQDLRLALGVGEAAPGLADLGLVFLLQRHDLVPHHGADLLDKRLHLGRHAEVHACAHGGRLRAASLICRQLKHAHPALRRIWRTLPHCALADPMQIL